MSTIFDTDIDFDGTVVEDGLDADFDRWFAEMTSDTSDEYIDAEDAEWNENIFEGEDDEDDQPAPVQVSVPVATVVKTRDAKKCREWARANGFQVGNRGVIATEVWDAYLAS